MRILFDLRVLSESWSGIAVYTVNLLRAISNSPVSKDIILVLKDSTIFKNLKEKHEIDPDNFFKVYYICDNTYNPFSFIKLRRIIKREQVTGYFTPQFFWTYGFLNVKKTVCMIHDIIPLTHPHLISQSRKSKFRFLLRLLTFFSLKFSYKVVVNSDATLKSLQDLFNKKTISNCMKIYPVLSNGTFSFDYEKKMAKSEKEKNKGYILYVGRQDPYKNLVRLIQSFKLIKDESKYSGKLLLAGSNDPRYPDAYKEVEKLKLEKDVIFLGFVEDKELESLYLNCDMAIQPSVCEGFGLTAFEPFKYGRLCIFSKIPSFMECFEKNMIYFDAFDVNDMKDKIIQALALSDEELNRLIKSGLESVKRFNSLNALATWCDLWS